MVYAMGSSASEDSNKVVKVVEFSQPEIAPEERADTVDIRHIKGHYYQSQHTINPTGIVAAGPLMDLTLPHGRS
jgi:glutathionyl-hydroquinone reductase